VRRVPRLAIVTCARIKVSVGRAVNCDSAHPHRSVRRLSSQVNRSNDDRTNPRRRELDVTDHDETRSAPPRAEPQDIRVRYPTAQPRAEQFDALVRELLPKIRQLSPHLSEIEALRAAARMAEYRLDDEATLVWGVR
jgi:hypothetical protein